MSYYIDNKQSFLNQFNQAQDQLTQRVKGKADSTNRRVEELELECAEEKRKAEAQCDAKIRQKEASILNAIRECNANATASIVEMQPYLLRESSQWEAPVLAKLPTLEQIHSQAEQRTYLPQVLVGYQKYKYGSKHLILPTYVDWQSQDPILSANVGNLILTYSSPCSASALALADSMVTRMLMAFPVKKLRLSILDPTSKGDECFSKWLENCPELYSNQVYKSSNDITKHIEMLNDRVGEIRQSYSSRTINSLVLHNKAGIKHEYELVILYDPFNERPYYAAALKNLIANGIKAGIYVLIIQSDNIKPDVLREFDFNSFTTAMEATEKGLALHRSNIKWNGDSFTGDTFETCEYLPSINPSSELNDPINPDDGGGLAQCFYRSLKDKLEDATASTTIKQWSDWQGTYDDADIQCWTEGIQVPIGYNADTNAEEYFYLNNKRPHSFVQGITGGGKSKFLCGLVSSVTMKYSPNAVQLYLLDFKDGLAFTYYKNVPHVRWLFTVQADKVMLSEVLRDLEREKLKRAKSFKKTGSIDICKHNKVMLERGEKHNCLPRILLVVDECQMIYLDNSESSLAATLQKKFISKKFEEIAKQYRAYGIHLILASQKIPYDMNDWISQISNNYILDVGNENFAKLVNNEMMCDTIRNRVRSIGRGFGVYSTQDEAYTTMFAYDSYEYAGDRIRKRAETLLGNQIHSYETHVWDGELELSYFKTKVASSVSIEFGSNLILSSAVGIEFKKEENNNVLLYGGDLGEDKAKELTMRTVISTLRTSMAERKVYGTSPTIYIVNAWKQLIDANKILKNLAEQNYIELVDPENLGELLLQLQEQIENKKSTPILLYMIGTNRMDVLKTDVIKPDMIATTNYTGRGDEATNKYSNGPSFLASYQKTSLGNPKTGMAILNMILDKGPDLGIHTILQINDVDEMEKLGLKSSLFKYMIFQKAKSFQRWKTENRSLDLATSIQELSVEKDSARTVFSNSLDPDVEQQVVPFTIDELIDVVNCYQSVGEYMIQNIVVE